MRIRYAAMQQNECLLNDFLQQQQDHNNYPQLSSRQQIISTPPLGPATILRNYVHVGDIIWAFEAWQIIENNDLRIKVVLISRRRDRKQTQQRIPMMLRIYSCERTVNESANNSFRNKCNNIYWFIYRTSNNNNTRKTRQARWKLPYRFCPAHYISYYALCEPVILSRRIFTPTCNK